VSEIRDGRVVDYTIDPEEMGISPASPDEIKGGSAKENAAAIMEILGGAKGPKSVEEDGTKSFKKIKDFIEKVRSIK
jgi:anthranilate phosphoribosyltransferase